MDVVKKAERNPKAFLTAILLLGAFLRLAAIGRESLWFDEALSYLIAGLPVRDILGNAARSSHPPLYYLILHYWLGSGPRSDALLRLPDVFWSLLQIAVGYQMGLVLFARKKLAIFAAFLLAIAPFQIFYSHELRMYALVMLLTSSTVLAYLKARKTERWQWWFAFSTLALLAVYTHMFSIFVLVAVGLHAILRRAQRKALVRTAVIGLILFLLFLPWLFLLFAEPQDQLGSLRPLAQPSSDAITLLIPLLTVTFMLFGYSTAGWYTGLALFLALSMLIFFSMELLKRRRTSSVGRLVLPLLVIGCVIGVPTAIHAIRPFFLPERTMAPAAVFLTMLLAWPLGRRHTPLRYVVAVSALLMFVGTLLYINDEPLKPPYRTVMNLVEAQRLPGDAVLHTSDGSYFPALRYTGFEAHGLLEGDPDPRKSRRVYERFGGQLWSRQEARTKGQRLWLIVALEHSQQWQQEQLAYFDNEFSRIASYDIEGIIVNLYDLP